ncbi:MAG: type I-U CRISPR-associated protein Cas7, partial [Nannocystaceae bacterium]
RASKLGRSLTDASPTDARAMLASCPTALVFGAWDSTGPRGGMGNKFQRSLVSEVVGIDFVAGTSVGSRMDPLQIAASVPVQAPKGEKSQWTIAKKGKQRPSEINHSTIAPNRNTEAGGVTFAYALHTAVLSLPALRRLRFGNWDGTKSDAARTLLAALGILALVLQRRCGYDFRSRCALVPEGPSPIELVAADGTVTAVEASVDQAVAVFKQAVAAAKKAGVTWSDGDVLLQPMPKLVQLILASREAHRVGPVET